MLPRARALLARRMPVSGRVSWLDFKLGVRMLVRYPVLTIVGGLAMAFAIGAGAGIFEAIKRVTDPVVPLPDGERIVGLNFWDTAQYAQKPPTPHDFLAWRERLRAVQDMGGFRLVQRNLAVGQESGEPVEVAEISAAAFRVTRVPPLFGRTLVEADEDPRAAPVVVLGHRLWQTRFGRDPAVVGRVVRLGDTRATVIGVMPEGFAFPVYHSVWTALRPAQLPREPGRGVLRVFGRLAPGVALPEAQAELTTLAARAAAEFPDQYVNLRAQVLPYAESIIWIPPDFLVRVGIHAANVFAALLLVVICGNVGLLMFARAATREREILVRGALGASRGRIVMQLFAEALVLGALAALAGLTATDYGLKWVLDAMSTESDAWPFWVEGGLSLTTLTYAVVLTLLAAVVAGVVPALKVTGNGIETRLREASAGAGGLRMGGIWTGAIIAQIAATVLFTAVGYVAQRQAARIASAKAAFPAEEYLAVRLEMDRRNPTEDQADPIDDDFRQHYATTVGDLKRRLAAEPTIAGVALAERLPLMPQSNDPIEVDEQGAGASPSPAEHRVGTAAVDQDFFEVFQARLLSGHGFALHDLEKGAKTVVVNRLFVDRILQGRNAIGRRIRYRPEDVRSLDEPRPWLEIVGVVSDLVPDADAPLRLDDPAKPLVYRALGPGDGPGHPLYLAAHVRGDAGSFAPTLRRIAADLSPTLRLGDLQRLDRATSADARTWNGLADLIMLVSAIALFLSLAGIYAVMSFTVARRTREIAVRVALGAQARGVVAEVLRRPLINIAAGTVLGSLLVGSLVALSTAGSDADVGTVWRRAGLVLAYGIVMTAVCALACVGPTLRALRVEPVDALRED